MSAEAAKEWLDQAKSDIKRIQGTYTTIGIFIVVILYTIFSQQSQIRERNARLKETVRFTQLPWRKLETIYAIPPLDSYISEGVIPWLELCQLTSATLIVKGESDPQQRTPEMEEEIKQISDAVIDLSHYNAKLQNIKGARQMNIPFENLDPGKLQDLIDVFNFKREEAEEQKLGERFTVAKTRAKSLLDSLEKEGNKIGFTANGIRILKKGVTLEDFSTLRVYLIATDFRTFGDDGLTKDESAQLLRALGERKFNSLSKLYSDEAQLNREISQLEKETNISLPIIGISLPIHSFGIFGGALNSVLLLYLLYVLRRLKGNLRSAYHNALSPDLDLLQAVVNTMPFAAMNRKAATIMATIILIMPGAISAFLLISQGEVNIYAKLSVFLTLIIFVAASVRIIKMTHEIAGLIFIPPAKSS